MDYAPSKIGIMQIKIEMTSKSISVKFFIDTFLINTYSNPGIKLWMMNI